jgi:hypothetical protein
LNSVAAIERPILGQPRPARLRVILALGAFALLWFILYRQLSGEWWLNEQYSYSWLMPFFCTYLFCYAAAWAVVDPESQAHRGAVI